MVRLVVHRNMCKKLRNLWWRDKNCSMKINWCLIADVWNTILTDGLPLSPHKQNSSQAHVASCASVVLQPTAGQCHSLGRKEHLENITIAEPLMSLGFFPPTSLYFCYNNIKETGSFGFCQACTSMKPCGCLRSGRRGSCRLNLPSCTHWHPFEDKCF